MSPSSRGRSLPTNKHPIFQFSGDVLIPETMKHQRNLQLLVAHNLSRIFADRHILFSQGRLYDCVTREAYTPTEEDITAAVESIQVRVETQRRDQHPIYASIRLKPRQHKHLIEADTVLRRLDQNNIVPEAQFENLPKQKTPKGVTRVDAAWFHRDEQAILSARSVFEEFLWLLQECNPSAHAAVKALGLYNAFGEVNPRLRNARRIFILCGPNQSGKGTIQRILACVPTFAPIITFSSDDGTEYRSENIFGAPAALRWCDEFTAKKAESSLINLLKSVTHGESINVRRVRAAARQVQASGTIVFCMNPIAKGEVNALEEVFRELAVFEAYDRFSVHYIDYRNHPRVRPLVEKLDQSLNMAVGRLAMGLALREWALEHQDDELVLNPIPQRFADERHHQSQSGLDDFLCALCEAASAPEPHTELGLLLDYSDPSSPFSVRQKSGSFVDISKGKVMIHQGALTALLLRRFRGTNRKWQVPHHLKDTLAKGIQWSARRTTFVQIVRREADHLPLRLTLTETLAPHEQEKNEPIETNQGQPPYTVPDSTVVPKLALASLNSFGSEGSFFRELQDVTQSLTTEVVPAASAVALLSQRGGDLYVSPEVKVSRFQRTLSNRTKNDVFCCPNVLVGGARKGGFASTRLVVVEFDDRDPPDTTDLNTAAEAHARDASLLLSLITGHLTTPFLAVFSGNKSFHIYFSLLEPICSLQELKAFRSGVVHCHKLLQHRLPHLPSPDWSRFADASGLVRLPNDEMLNGRTQTAFQIQGSIPMQRPEFKNSATAKRPESWNSRVLAPPGERPNIFYTSSELARITGAQIMSRRVGDDGWTCLCPVHKDKHPSAFIKDNGYLWCSVCCSSGEPYAGYINNGIFRLWKEACR